MNKGRPSGRCKVPKPDAFKIDKKNGNGDGEKDLEEDRMGKKPRRLIQICTPSCDSTPGGSFRSRVSRSAIIER